MFSVVMLVISALTAQTPFSGVPGSLQGVVCEVQTCKPIAGARLVVSIPGVQGSRRTAVTDTAGNFRFQQLPPGKYQFIVDADNFAASGILPLVTVSDGATVQGLKIEMRALGTISGRAFDETGEPLGGARVEALAFRPQGWAYRMLMPAGDAETDDRGDFRIPALEPDEYYVRIVPPINRVIQNSYPITYYPNTTDPAGAAKIVVTGGAEISGIDPRLSTRGVKVRGRIANPNNDNSRAILYLMLRSPSVFVLPLFGPNTFDQTSDDFELRGVAPGSYYVYAITKGSPPLPAEWVRLPLEVGDKDVENVTVPIIPAGTIKGRIIIATDASDTETLDLSKITINAGTTELVPGSPRIGASAQVAKNGEFQFLHVPEMRLFVSDRVLNDNWFISSVRFDGSDVTTTGFSATPGKDSILEVVISNASGTLAGVIKDGRQKPVPAGRLALLPEPSARANPFLIRTGVAIENGEVLIETIPPGEYTAIAFPDEDQFTPAFLRNLPSVEKYERFGHHVHVGAGETTRLELTVAPVSPN